MKTFENNQRKDTILNTGLLAIGIIWIALAAARGPVGVDTDAAAALSRNVMSAQPADLAGAHGTAAPAAATHASHRAVS